MEPKTSVPSETIQNILPQNNIRICWYDNNVLKFMDAKKEGVQICCTGKYL